MDLLCIEACKESLYLSSLRINQNMEKLNCYISQISESPLLKKMWAKMNQLIREGTDVLSGDHQKHLNMVYEGNYAYFSDLSTFELETAKRCDLAVIKDKFAPVHYTIGLQNNSAYYDIFSQG